MSGAVSIVSIVKELACAEEYGPDGHVLLADERDQLVLMPSSAAGQVAVRCVRDAPAEAIVMATGPSAVRVADALALAGRLVRLVQNPRATGRMLETMVREADVGSPQVSGIEVIDAVEALEAAAEKSGDTLDTCYSHWANLALEQLRQEFLDCEQQLLRDVRSGMDWLESELKNYPSVDFEMEYGVMGR